MKRGIILFIIICIYSGGYCLKPEVGYRWTPNWWGLLFNEYKIMTSDNFELNTWFYPAQEELSKDSTQYYLNAKTATRPYEIDTTARHPTIVICNGDAGNMSYLLSYAKGFSTKGYNVLTFDWRGFGESQTFPVDTNYMVHNEFLLDYDAVIDFVKTLPTVDTTKIGAFGFSTGAFLTYATAYKRNEIKAIVVRGLFTDYKNIVQHLTTIKPNDTYGLPSNGDIDFYSPRKTWENFDKPIFLIVGEEDKITPKENSIEILANVNSRVRKLWIVKDAEHGGAKSPEFINLPLFLERTLRFFDENLH
jgi:hypothetical protein